MLQKVFSSRVIQYPCDEHWEILPSLRSHVQIKNRLVDNKQGAHMFEPNQEVMCQNKCETSVDILK